MKKKLLMIILVLCVYLFSCQKEINTSKQLTREEATEINNTCSGIALYESVAPGMPSYVY